mmetsp:Transcript_4765/g.5341  ORF Transcript_4765/g.5341 Transcript_4765/m.5341 type:complete len:375 (+) Transcript_4765:1220-2344(+)
MLEIHELGVRWSWSFRSIFRISSIRFGISSGIRFGSGACVVPTLQFLIVPGLQISLELFLQPNPKIRLVPHQTLPPLPGSFRSIFNSTYRTVTATPTTKQPLDILVQFIQRVLHPRQIVIRSCGHPQQFRNTILTKRFNILPQIRTEFTFFPMFVGWIGHRSTLVHPVIKHFLHSVRIFGRGQRHIVRFQPLSIPRQIFQPRHGLHAHQRPSCIRDPLGAPIGDIVITQPRGPIIIRDSDQGSPPTSGLLIKRERLFFPVDLGRFYLVLELDYAVLELAVFLVQYLQIVRIEWGRGCGGGGGRVGFRAEYFVDIEEIVIVGCAAAYAWVWAGTVHAAHWSLLVTVETTLRFIINHRHTRCQITLLTQCGYPVCR